ncbi:MAG: hypothetical protein HZA79_00110 [Sphingobacteriales bacterium]|nr:hypothetical protein [Sphingobacteriales bacterium]
MKKDSGNTNETKLDKMIQKAFRTGGFLFPETPEEVAEFEKKFGNTDIILPDELREPTFLTSKRTAPVKKKLAETTDNFAMAAREGSKLPEEVLKKMKEHRDKAKREKEK